MTQIKPAQSSVDIMKNRINSGFPGGADRATTQITMNEMPITVTIDQLRPSDVLPRLKRKISNCLFVKKD